MSEQPKIASPERKEEEQRAASPISVHNNEQSNDTLEPETIHEKVEQTKENDVSEVLDAQATKEEQEGAKPDNDAELEMRGRAPSPLVIPTPEELTAAHPAEDLHPPDSPTTSLISSLRSQLLSLSDQTHALNSKLIASISHSADLEDELQLVKDQHVALGERAKSLEEERNRWEESMKTGLLVERDQIRDEMQRLAAGLVEEERRRGSAEEKRAQVENEVDDLTAKLFDQANTMVATERMSRAQAEARLKSAEESLANAEAVVQAVQVQLQNLSVVASGDKALSGPSLSRKYVSSHIPYSEFINFIQHLRAARPLADHVKQSSSPPLITNLLAQPFLARVMAEDHEPTVRLESAPALSFLSRRTVGNAIISGDLVIEPVTLANVLQSTGSTQHDLACSLCGKKVFHAVPSSPATGGYFATPVPHPHRNSGSGTSRFSLKPFFNASHSSSNGSSVSPKSSPLTSPSLLGSSSSASTHVFVFRIARSQGTTTPSGEKESSSKLYPICKSGWCLERLRATCELWHFVRTGIVHVVWHSEDGVPAVAGDPRISSPSSTPAPAPIEDRTGPTEVVTESSTPTPTQPVEPPPLPARKKSWGLGWSWKNSGSETNNADGKAANDDEDEVGSVGAEKDNVSGPAIVAEAIEAAKVAEAAEQAKKESAELMDVESKGKEKELVSIEGEEAEETIIEKAEEAQKEPSEEQPDSTPGSPSLKLPGSLGLVNSSSTIPASDVTFSTPKGESPELPAEDVIAVAGVIEESEDGEAAEETKAEEVKEKEDGAQMINEGEKQDEEKRREQFISLNTPTVESTPTLDSPTTPVSAVDPPPVPKRAAARNKSSQLDGTNGSTASLGLITDDAKEDEKDEVKESENVDEAIGVEGAMKSGEPSEPAPVSDSSQFPPPPHHPNIRSSAPPLPPRNVPTQFAPPPRRRLASQQPVPEGEEKKDKTYLSESAEGENWEDKTWKGVVRLKENMWKARVGVVDEE
ncbi:hypothetical protein CNJ00770 [Cryptococcus gattii WM276]|uniref:GDP/GTP exchange factor Sec2 N-terminal domain-containing protein n=1 Tax=Cryptococcus gattii serotype B (strain WM276 / ATCC MYA-4071) TaxID=367775 RepID=E6R4Z1_CRYGW|nr:uncharacterized protein CGB_D9010W [Cryptococcus gattii WM276]ADV22251.1 hypothetical protein CNJ00770 [Cryptococcus gattii WM276]